MSLIFKIEKFFTSQHPKYCQKKGENIGYNINILYLYFRLGLSEKKRKKFEL